MTPDAPEDPVSLSLTEASRIVDEWIRSTGKGYFAPLTNMARLTEEVGELARIFARRYGELAAKPTDDTSDRALAEELADVLFVLLCLANQADVDLEAALRLNLEKITRRDLHSGRHDRT